MLRLSVLLLSLLLAAAPAAGQMCPADTDRSGEATVDELVAAVGGGLGQCRADPGCPYGFTDDTGQIGDCYFVGSLTDSAEPPTCTIDDIEAAYYSDGEVVVLFFPSLETTLYFGADAFDPEVGLIFGWTEDLGQQTEALDGVMLLDEQHSVIAVGLEDSPFVIDGCQFDFFVGQFDALVQVEGSSAARSPLQRLRSFRAARPKPPAVHLTSKVRRR